MQSKTLALGGLTFSPFLTVLLSLFLSFSLSLSPLPLLESASHFHPPVGGSRRQINSCHGIVFILVRIRKESVEGNLGSGVKSPQPAE